MDSFEIKGTDNLVSYLVVNNIFDAEKHIIIGALFGQCIYSASTMSQVWMHF